MQFYTTKENDVLRNRLKDLSETDLLTGANNRRFFYTYLDLEIKRQRSHIKYGNANDINVGIAMIDFDDVKNINDTYGHLVGDRVLEDAARITKEALFERDISCRYGGEEFVILFTSTSKSGAMIAIEKIRRTMEDYQFGIGEKPLPEKVIISIGFASFDEESDLYRLLEAKSRGKNRVISA
ncbi:MAG: GGDEF domain-containing protein [Spirochaetales bacterium]|nr:GGDEF domain-containing protein [Spirochaetales bacterium]